MHPHTLVQNPQDLSLLLEVFLRYLKALRSPFLHLTSSGTRVVVGKRMMAKMVPMMVPDIDDDQSPKTPSPLPPASHLHLKLIHTGTS